jgi:hypothetical protein
MELRRLIAACSSEIRFNSHVGVVPALIVFGIVDDTLPGRRDCAKLMTRWFRAGMVPNWDGGKGS